jgi:predicted cupin superfamily sugar epimerase
MNIKAKYFIDKLKLLKHPEGGYYREIYRSGEFINIEGLPNRYGNRRVFSTSIYFLLDGRQVSKFHRLKSDEVWHFYYGSSIKIYIIDENKKLNEITLGNDLSKGEIFQFTITKNNWFGAELIDKNSFALIGCSVSPGFDFEDFELADKDMLLKNFPQFENVIKRLT